MDTFHLILSLLIIMFFCDWNNYVFGRPLEKDFSLTAIMFWLPEALARRKLRRHGYIGFLDEAQARVEEEMLATKDKLVRSDLWREHRRYVYELGQRQFTWEKTFLCPVCLHWWLSLIFICGIWALGYTFDLGIALLTYLFTHYLIKKF